MELGERRSSQSSPYLSPTFQSSHPPSCQPLPSNFMTSSSSTKQQNSAAVPIFNANFPAEIMALNNAAHPGQFYGPGPSQMAPGAPNQFLPGGGQFYAGASAPGGAGPGTAFPNNAHSGMPPNAGNGAVPIQQIKKEVKQEIMTGPMCSTSGGSVANNPGPGTSTSNGVTAVAPVQPSLPLRQNSTANQKSENSPRGGTNLPVDPGLPHQFQHQTRSFVYIFTSELAKNASEAVNKGLYPNIIEYHKKHHQVKSRQQPAPPLYHHSTTTSTMSNVDNPPTPPFGIGTSGSTTQNQPMSVPGPPGPDGVQNRVGGPLCSPVTPTVTQSPQSGFGSKQTTPKTVATVAPQPSLSATVTPSGPNAQTSSTQSVMGNAPGSGHSMRLPPEPLSQSEAAIFQAGGLNSRKRPIGSPASVPPAPPKTPLTPLDNGPASVQPVSSVNFAFEKGVNPSSLGGGCNLPTATMGPNSSASTTTATASSSVPISSYSVSSPLGGVAFGQIQVPVSGNSFIDRSNLPITEVVGLDRIDPGDDPLQKMARLANQSLPLFNSEPAMKQMKTDMQPCGPMSALKDKAVIAPNDLLTPEQREHREKALQRIEMMRAQFCLSESASQPLQQPGDPLQMQNPTSTAGMQYGQPPGYPCGPGPMPGGPMMMRVPRPGMVMGGPGDCMPGQVMMMAGGPHGAQMQMMGPGPHHQGMIQIESTPQQQMQAALEWQKLVQDHEMKQYQKQNQDFMAMQSPEPTPGVQPISSTGAPPGPKGGKGARQRQPRPMAMPVPGTRMSIQQPGKPMVMVAPNVMQQGGPRGRQRMPIAMRGQRMAMPRMTQEQMAYMNHEEQMMMQQQHQQFMMGPGGQQPRARMMMVQQGGQMQMMASGPPPEMMMAMEGGGGYCGPPDQNFPSEMGYMGEMNQGSYMQDFVPQGGMMDPGGGMIMGPNGQFFCPNGPPEFDGNPNQMKMQMLNSGGFEMDVQGATGPLPGQPGQPTVNNTYVNATMSIQQLNIQNVGPPIHQLPTGSTPPLCPSVSGPPGTFHMRTGPPVSDGPGGGPPEFGMPPFSFQSMPEPLTNLDSKVPSQKLQYFPTSKPSSSSSAGNTSGTASVSMAGGVRPDGSMASVPTPCSMGYQPVGMGNSNQMENFGRGNVSLDHNSPSAQYVNISQPNPAPMSQAQYGSFENFQQQLYASNSNSGSK